MAIVSRKTERRTGWTPPASQFQEEYYPVQSFAWIGKSGDAATDFPYCGEADFDQIENAGIAGLDLAGHGDNAYLIWRVPQLSASQRATASPSTAPEPRRPIGTVSVTRSTLKFIPGAKISSITSPKHGRVLS